MKRLYILFEHGADKLPYASSMIRMQRPLAYPGVPLPWEVSVGPELPTFAPQVMIIERLWRPGITVQDAQAVLRTLRQQGTRVVYTLDDDLFALPWDASALNAGRLFARHAERVIVSTEPLARRMALLNPNCCVLPNQIDDTLFGPPPQIGHAPQTPLVLGYMGTPTHLSDLLSILVPLRQILHRYADRVRLELVGVTANPHVLSLFEGLPVSIKSPEGHVAYDRFVAWMKQELRWDIAIAPLVDNRFNESKSDLKFLDYSALGIPGVFSDVASYQNTVQHGVTGFLAASDEQWYQHLETLILDADQRQLMAQRAVDYVYAHRSLSARATEWITAIGF